MLSWSVMRICNTDHQRRWVKSNRRRSLGNTPRNMRLHFASFRSIESILTPFMFNSYNEVMRICNTDHQRRWVKSNRRRSLGNTPRNMRLHFASFRSIDSILTPFMFNSYNRRERFSKGQSPKCFQIWQML